MDAVINQINTLPYELREIISSFTVISQLESLEDDNDLFEFLAWANITDPDLHRRIVCSIDIHEVNRPPPELLERETMIKIPKRELIQLVPCWDENVCMRYPRAKLRKNVSEFWKVTNRYGMRDKFVGFYFRPEYDYLVKHITRQGFV